MRLNLGCGKLKLDGYINADISPRVEPDACFDVRLGIPFQTEYFDEVNSGCMIEQIGPNDQFIFVLNEVWRVLKHNGLFRGYVPSIEKDVLFLDPMDRRFFQVHSFDYFIQGKDSYENFGKSYGFEPWRKQKIEQADNHIIHFELLKP